MDEVEGFEVGESLADVAEAFVVDAVAVEGDGLEVRPALELGEGMARDVPTEAEAFEVLQPGELLESGVGGFAELMQGKGLQIGERRELRKFREGSVARVGAGPHLNAQGFEALQFEDRIQG